MKEWEIIDGLDDTISIDQIADGMVEREICTVIVDDAEDRANAKLICAAPALLEACKLIRDTRDKMANSQISRKEFDALTDGRPFDDWAADVCEAAIAAATK